MELFSPVAVRASHGGGQHPALSTANPPRSPCRTQTQMQSNELLREILGVSKWGGTGGEKPFYSKNSEARKQQTTNRTRSRHSKQIAQDDFLGGGSEHR